MPGTLLCLEDEDEPEEIGEAGYHADGEEEGEVSQDSMSGVHGSKNQGLTLLSIKQSLLKDLRTLAIKQGVLHTDNPHGSPLQGQVA